MIRRAEPHEADALHVLAAETFPLACPPGSTAEDQRRFIDEHLSAGAFCSYLDDPDRVVLVDEGQDGALRGYTMLVFGDPTDADVRAAVAQDGGGPIAELSKCYAHPAAHGTGVASALLIETARIAAVRGAERLWLGVNQENLRAQRFYAKHGFAVVGTKRFHVGERIEDDYVLVKTLTNAASLPGAEHPSPVHSAE